MIRRSPKRRRSSSRHVGVAGTVVLLAALALVRVLRPGHEPPRPQPRLEFDQPLTGRVERVVDGDTIDVSPGLCVRLVGIDTLETRTEGNLDFQAELLRFSRDQAIGWGRKAKSFVESALDSKEVELRPGSDAHDKYGRLLAYVWFRPRDGAEPVCLNRLLLDEGLALATRSFKHPEQDSYLAAESRARAARKGLWAQARWSGWHYPSPSGERAR